jgi:hypothetical protein
MKPFEWHGRVYEFETKVEKVIFYRKLEKHMSVAVKKDICSNCEKLDYCVVVDYTNICSDCVALFSAIFLDLHNELFEREIFDFYADSFNIHNDNSKFNGKC